LQLRLLDFASVWEANASMKAGDIGRVMYMWRRWSVMAQGFKKLSNYAVQLPRTIVLINEVFPPGLSMVVRHSLLVAPSDQQNHFQPKNCTLRQRTIGWSTSSTTPDGEPRLIDWKMFTQLTYHLYIILAYKVFPRLTINHQFCYWYFTASKFDPGTECWIGIKDCHTIT
jgi:hypothetical protein